MTVSAPGGLRLGPSRGGVAVTSGGKRIRHTVSLAHGKLVIEFAHPQATIRVAIAGPSLWPSGSRIRRRLRVTPTDATGSRTSLTARLKL